MQTILQILERAGGYRPTLSFKIGNPPTWRSSSRPLSRDRWDSPACPSHTRRTKRRPHARPGDVLRAVATHPKQALPRSVLLA